MSLFFCSSGLCRHHSRERAITISIYLSDQSTRTSRLTPAAYLLYSELFQILFFNSIVIISFPHNWQHTITIAAVRQDSQRAKAGKRGKDDPVYIASESGGKNAAFAVVHRLQFRGEKQGWERDPPGCGVPRPAPFQFSGVSSVSFALSRVKPIRIRILNFPKFKIWNVKGTGRTRLSIGDTRGCSFPSASIWTTTSNLNVL